MDVQNTNYVKLVDLSVDEMFEKAKLLVEERVAIGKLPGFYQKRQGRAGTYKHYFITQFYNRLMNKTLHAQGFRPDYSKRNARHDREHGLA